MGILHHIVPLRDYACGVIERAVYLGADSAVDTKLVEPPYPSEWPHIPDDSEMTILDPPFEEDHPERSDAESGTVETNPLFGDAMGLRPTM